MTDVAAIKDYLRKIQRTVEANADFGLMNDKFIKKNKIDDLLCCIYATLPDAYKKLLRSSELKKYKSAICLDTLINKLKHKFLFNPSIYVVNVNEIKSLVSTCISTIETDLAALEKLTQ